MARCLRFLALLAACLAFAEPSTAVTDRAQVEDITTGPVQARQVKVGANSMEVEPPGEVTIRDVKAAKLGLAATEFEALSTREPKVPKLSLEGIPELPKKVPPEDEAIVDDAARKAESDQGGPGANGDPRAEGNAAMDASLRAERQALKEGRDPSEAHDIAEAVRERVKEDYARAADGGSLSAPPPEAQPQTPAPAPPSGPEVLEAPPPEPGVGDDANGGAGPGAQVIEVPQQQP